MTDTPGPDSPEPYDPAMVEALVSMDLVLSDLEEGNLVDRHGEPLHPVAAIELRYATPADLQQARLILAARHELDQARYEDIARAADLTLPYRAGASTLEEVTARMPAAEAAELTQIMQRLQPAAAPPAGNQARDAELAKLMGLDQAINEFLAASHPRLAADGQPIPHPGTGEPMEDPDAAVQAIALGRHVQDSLLQLLSQPIPGVTVTADEAIAKFAELLERFPAAPGSGDSAAS